MSELKLLSGKDFLSVIAHGLTLVDFTASCCPPLTSREHLLVEWQRSVGNHPCIARVDLNESPDLVKRFGIVALPTLILFLDGIPKRSFSGDLTPEEFQQFVLPILPLHPAANEADPTEEIPCPN